MTANDTPTPDSAVPAAEPASIAAPTPEPTLEAPMQVLPEPATAPAAEAAAPAAGQAAAETAPMSPAACAERLKALFPALFTGPAKPIKLRIQADIQARAPGVFSKAALSGFLRRYTGGTGYLIALTRAPHRVDLDGQPAGEIAAEHRQAAADELARRRQVHEGRRQAEEDQRRERAQLLRAFQTTTLTKDNFCALKGMTPEALDALLAQARQEAEEYARERPPQQRPGGRPDQRGGPRPDHRPGGGHDRPGPRGDRRDNGPRGQNAARPNAGQPTGQNRGPQGGTGEPRGDAQPRAERGPRPPRPAR
jgi:hypothetical protein